jgi:hypothetical protein
MALLPGTLSRAGPLCSELLDLQVVEHGPNTGVVIIRGESDAPPAPELAARSDRPAGRCPRRGGGS